MVKYRSRSAWTNAEKGFAKHSNRRLKKNDVIFAACHYPASGRDLGDLDTATLLQGYWRYHVNTRGWADIGYCWGVDQDGIIWELAGDDYAAAHSASDGYKNANYEGIGILLLLGNNEEPSAKMIASLNHLLQYLRAKYPNMKKLYGHRQVTGAQTACPGDKVIALIAKGIISFNGSTSAPEVKEDDDMPLSDADVKKMGDHILNRLIEFRPAQFDTPKGKPGTRNQWDTGHQTLKNTSTLIGQVTALNGQVAALKEVVSQLQKGTGGVIDYGRIDAKIDAALSDLDVVRGKAD